MEKEFAPYEPSSELKELGFDEPCFGYYEPNKNLNYIERHILKDFPYLAKNSEWQDLCAAPTFSQAFRWFREKYNLNVEIRKYTAKYFTIVIQEIKDVVYFIEYGGINLKFNTYEEAELACLKKLIEIVKKSKIEWKE